MIYRIRSRSNPKVKAFLKERDEYFIFEGEKLIADILARDIPVVRLIVHENQEEGIRLFQGRVGEIWLVNESVLQKLSTLKDRSDFMAVVRIGKTKINFAKADVVAVMDNIQDPANAGTIFRCASAFGIRFIALTGAGVKPNNPKFLRTAQDSVFDVNFQSFADLDTLIKKSQIRSFSIYLTSARRPQNMVDIGAVRAPCLVVFGSEGRGLDPRLFERYPSIRLPQTRQVDSLNAGVAACIIMYEIRKKNIPQP